MLESSKMTGHTIFFFFSINLSVHLDELRQGWLCCLCVIWLYQHILPHNLFKMSHLGSEGPFCSFSTVNGKHTKPSLLESFQIRDRPICPHLSAAHKQQSICIWPLPKLPTKPFVSNRQSQWGFCILNYYFLYYYL